jgi:hypothetical protein
MPANVNADWKSALILLRHTSSRAFECSQISFRLNSRCASGSRGGYRLPINMILCISSCVDPFHVCALTMIRDDVAIFIQINLPF